MNRVASPYSHNVDVTFQSLLAVSLRVRKFSSSAAKATYPLELTERRLVRR
jgi:hypothetical protein